LHETNIVINAIEYVRLVRILFSFRANSGFNLWTK